MFAILVLLLSCCLVKGNEKKVLKCEDFTSGEIQVPLSCESDEMIHVVREISGPRVSTGEKCKINITNTDVKIRDRTNNGLCVNCNGRSACNETHAGLIKPNHTAVDVEYDCVGGSISMCSESSKQFIGNPLYLHSPGFPGNTEPRTCTCEVEGDMMTVELLEYNTTGTGWKIVGDNEVMPNTSFRHLFFNKVIFDNVAQIRMLFIDGHATDGKVWLKVTGKGGNASIEGTCTNSAGSLSTASTPDSRVTVSSPQGTTVERSTLHSASSGNTSTPGLPLKHDKKSFPVVIVAASVSGGVIVVFIFILLCVCCRRNKSNTEDGRVESNRKHKLQTRSSTEGFRDVDGTYRHYMEIDPVTFGVGPHTVTNSTEYFELEVFSDPGSSLNTFKVEQEAEGQVYNVLCRDNSSRDPNQGDIEMASQTNSVPREVSIIFLDCNEVKNKTGDDRLQKSSDEQQNQLSEIPDDVYDRLNLQTVKHQPLVENTLSSKKYGQSESNENSYHVIGSWDIDSDPAARQADESTDTIRGFNEGLNGEHCMTNNVAYHSYPATYKGVFNNDIITGNSQEGDTYSHTASAARIVRHDSVKALDNSSESTAPVKQKHGRSSYEEIPVDFFAQLT